MQDYEKIEPLDRKRGIRGDMRNIVDAVSAFWNDLLVGRSMRVFIGLAAISAGVLIWRDVSLTHFMIVWAFIVITLGAEAVNTVIEAICDLIWPRLLHETIPEVRARQPQVARIKHIAAAVVFVTGAFGTMPALILVYLYPR